MHGVERCTACGVWPSQANVGMSKFMEIPKRSNQRSVSAVTCGTRTVRTVSSAPRGKVHGVALCVVHDVGIMALCVALAAAPRC